MSVHTPFHLPVRMRRLRRTSALRALVQETQLDAADLIMPLFIKAGKEIIHPIASMPGCFQWSLDQLPAALSPLLEKGLTGVILFGIPEKKDNQGRIGSCEAGIIQQALEIIKKMAPHLLLIADLCLCEYTDHGHCGIPCLSEDIPHIHNDLTLPELVLQAVSLAKAGADIIAPSGMMDGMVSAIRTGLDQAGFTDLPILSYAVKYASALYGPFREAAEGAPQWGDRQTYQMNPANAREALREAELDVQEGADMLMVKPASFYLDVIQRVKQAFPALPLGAYQVSGEYAMIKAAAQQGWIDERRVVMESLISIKRAGADFIISYFTKDVLSWWQEKDNEQ